MHPLASACLDGALMAACLAYTLVCPYTKVEESFNLQAMHDLVYHGTQLHKYDHVEFPGVVPRSFLGPLLVSALSSPFIGLSHYLGATKFTSQYIVRFVLGGLVCMTFISFRRAAEKKLGSTVSTFLTLVTLSQFHFLFYASRPLPNTFALMLALLAFRCWLLQEYGRFIWVSGAAVLIFRSELALLLGLILLSELGSRRLGAWQALRHMVPAGVVWLTLTVAVDSVLWGRWVWPEGEVLWFNVVENKSHQWGTHPFLWYFLSALPRSLLLPLLLLPCAFYWDRRRALVLVGPALFFVLLYSFLPHKELRFVIYAVPLLNLVAAMGYASIWMRRDKLPLFAPVAAICSLLLSFCIALCFLHISRHNYPGGQAFRLLHSLVDRDAEARIGSVSVHVGVEAAMTGVSRFGELRPSWHYAKVEGLEPTSSKMLQFRFLLVSAGDFELYKETHSIVGKAEGFSGFSVNLKEFPPIKIALRDSIAVLALKGCRSTGDG